MKTGSISGLSLLKTILFALSLLPLGRLVWAAYTGDFGPNPVEFVQRWTGTWSFNFLLITLCVTPLRTITGWSQLIRIRRMLGLFCFFYATLHFLSFVGFDHDFSLGEIARDVLKRPFVTVGFAAYVLLIPLAATSNQWAIRRLGGRRWQSLHRTIYSIGILAAIHYFWLVKATAILWPIAYTCALAVLLWWRINHWRTRVPLVPTKPQGQALRFFPKRPQ